jgi:hypothetical protein
LLAMREINNTQSPVRKPKIPRGKLSRTVRTSMSQRLAHTSELVKMGTLKWSLRNNSGYSTHIEFNLDSWKAVLNYLRSARKIR